MDEFEDDVYEVEYEEEGAPTTRVAPNVDTLKTIASAAGAGEEEQALLDGGFTSEAYMRTANRIISQDVNDMKWQFQKEAAAANVEGALMAAQSAAALEEYIANKRSEVEDSVTVATAAADNLFLNNEAARINNTSEEASNALTKVGNTVGTSEYLKRLEQQDLASYSIGGLLSGLAVEIVPFANLAQMQGAIPLILERSGFGKATEWQGMLPSTIREEFQGMLAMLPEEEQKAAIDRVYEQIADITKDYRVPGTDARFGMLQEFIYKDLLLHGDAGDAMLEDIFFTAGAPLDALGVGVAVRAARIEARIAKLLKEDTIAKNVANITGVETVGIDAAAVLRGEASALNQKTIDALTSSLSFDIKNITPGSIRGASSAVQTDLAARAEKLITEMQSLVRAGRSTEEVQEALLRTLQQYDPSVNKGVHSLGLIDNTGRLVITWKHPSGYDFPTRESAEAFAASRGMTSFEVVPAKGSGGWMVKDEVLDSWKAEAATLTDELVEAVNAASAAAGIKPHIRLKPATKVRAMADPSMSMGDLIKMDIDETLGLIPDLSDALTRTIERLSDGGDAVTQDMLRLAEESLDRLDEAAMRLELDPSLYGDMDFYEEIGELYSTIKGITSFKEPSVVATDLASIGKVVGAATFSPSITSKAQKVVSSIMESLGISDEILVLTAKDLAREFDEAAYLRGKYADYTHHAGLYVPKGTWFNDKAVIIVKDGGTSSKAARTLIHEMGHHYDYSVLSKMDDATRSEMMKDFHAWRKNRGKMESLPDFLKYSAAFRSGVYDDAAKAMADYSVWKNDPEYQKWMSSFTEYFAEQFTKAFLTDRVDSSLLGKFFASIVQGWRTMYARAQEVFGVAFDDVDESIVDHILRRMEDVRDGNVSSAEWSGLEEGVGYTPRAMLEATLTDKTMRLSELESLIDAAEEAKAGISTGFLVKEKSPIDLDLSTLKFSDEDVESMVWLGIDPKHTASGLLVEQRYTGIHTEARIRKLLADFMKPAINGLSAKERVLVEDLLIKGDAYSKAGGVGKEFSPLEIRAELPSNISKKSVERIENAYYSFRTARNALHQVRDQAMAKSLRSQGYQRITLFVGEDAFTSAARTFDVAERIGQRVYDVDTGRIITVNDELAEATDGRVVVETMEALSTDKGEITRFLVQDGALIKARINSVVPYRPGEYSRIYDDEYFIDITKNVTRNGAAEEVTSTTRTAKSKKEATEYVAAMNSLLSMVKRGEAVGLDVIDRLVGKWEDSKALADVIRRGDWDDVDKFDYHYNRTEEEFTNDYVRMSANSGKMFVDKRGSEVVSISGERNTLKPFDSLQAEVSNVSRVASLTEWRDTAIARWYNTFKPMLPKDIRDKDMFDAFFAMTDSTYVGSEKAQKFAERSHKYIMRQLGVKSKEERFYEAQARAFSERFMGEGVLEPVGRLLRKASPIQFIRSINFHTMLAMFNPAQLYVQAAGAATAVAIHPVHGLHAAKGAALLRMALMSDNPEVWKTFGKVEAFTSLGFRSTEDLIESVQLVRKSGLLDGIKSTSLYSIEEGRFNIFANTAQKALESGTFFFNRGEEYARLVAFLVAKAEWQDANKGKKVSDTDLTALMARTDDFTQNMSNNNRAFFQQGALSIPTQFLQFHAKLATNILTAFLSKGKRGFTKKEAAALITGHYVLFGLNGNFTPDVVKEWLGDNVPQDMDKKAVLTLNEGIMAGVLSSVAEIFGEEAYLAVGTRTGALNFYSELVSNIMAGDATLIDTMLGVSKATMDRASKSGQVFSLWWKDPNLTADDVLLGTKNLTTTWVSSLRNIDKAWYAYNNEGYFYNNNDDRVAQAKKWEIFAQAVGMQSADVTDYYNLVTSKRKHYENMRSVAKEIARLQAAQVRAVNSGDEAQARDIKAIIQTLWPNSVTDLQFVQKELREKVYPFDTLLQKELMNEVRMKTSDRSIPITTTREP